MTITNGPNLGLMVNGNAGEAHYSQFMALLRGLDGLVMPCVLGYLTNTPPASPADGDCYIIGAAPTGAWAGQGGKVARYSTVAATWETYAPHNGWMLQASSAREAYRYTGGAWEVYYQEGTWTPTLAGGTTAGSNTYSIQFGRYTKIGRVVVIQGRLDWTATSGMTGITVVPGMPFTPGSSTFGSLAIADIGGVTLNSGFTFVNLYVAGSMGNQIRLRQNGSGVSANDITSSTQVSSTGTLTFAGMFTI